MRKHEDQDEISLKEAAQYVDLPADQQPGWSKDGKYKTFTLQRRVDDEDDPEARRERETGNAGATLEAMLAASRHGKTVK